MSGGQLASKEAECAISPQVAGSLQFAVLILRKMKKAQRDRARAIADRHLETARAAVHDIAGNDLPFEQTFVVGMNLAQGRELRAVLIAGRQMQQYVYEPMDAELGQRFRKARADPLQARNGGSGVCCHRAMTASISMRAARGRALTCTAALAG